MNFEILKILIREKFNKRIQKRYVYVPAGTSNIVITSYSELYLTESVPKIYIDVSKKMAEDKNTFLAFVGILLQRGKTVVIVENEKMFEDEDIKLFAAYSKNIYINQRYIDSSNSIARNQKLEVKIDTLRTIIDKIEFFKEKCNEVCMNDFDKVIYTMVNLTDYISYTTPLEKTSCLENALLYHNGVCIDFTIAFWKCMEALGIECEIIKGISNEETVKSKALIYDHAWNQVKLYDKWYNIDITWFKTSNSTKFVLVHDDDFDDDSDKVHKTIFKTHTCKDTIDRDLVNAKVREYRNQENVFKLYDKKMLESKS